jgi:hypothetical protein
MASRGISLHYWLDEYPILLDALAVQTPGMTPLGVAEVLDDLDFELATEATEQGEPLDVTDDALIGMYLSLL